METRLGLRGCMLWRTAGGAALWGRPPVKGQGPRPGPAPAPEPRGPSSPALLRADPDARLRPPVALGRRERGEPPETPALPAPFDTHTPANMAAGRGRADCVRAPARPAPPPVQAPPRVPEAPPLRPAQATQGPARCPLAPPRACWHPTPAQPAQTRRSPTPGPPPHDPTQTTQPSHRAPQPTPQYSTTPKPHTRVPTTPNHHTNPGKFIPEPSHTANFTQTPQISPRLRHISQLHTPSPPPTHAQSPQPELKHASPCSVHL